MNATFESLKDSYNIMKSYEATSDKLKFFQNEHSKINEKYGLKDGDKIPENIRNDYIKDVESIFNFDLMENIVIDVLIDDIMKCKQSSNKDTWITPREIMVLKPYLKQEDDNNE